MVNFKKHIRRYLKLTFQLPWMAAKCVETKLILNGQMHSMQTDNILKIYKFSHWSSCSEGESEQS